MQANWFIVGESKDDADSIKMLNTLASRDIKCTYCLFNSLTYVARKITISKVILGCETMMNNGFLVARAGTASIAWFAKSMSIHDIPVIVCTETFKFSKKAVVHSLVSTELSIVEDKLGDKSHLKYRKVALKYDITPSKYLDMVVWEVNFGSLLFLFITFYRQMFWTQADSVYLAKV